MKNKIVTAAVILGAALLLGGCVSGTSLTSEIAEADPWEEFASLEEAQEEVGFELTAPDMSEYGDEEVYRVCAALTEIEIQYESGGSVSAYIRKAEDDGDISGDYEEYAYEEVVAVGDATVTYKGASEDEINLAIWYVGDYAYCIRIEEAVSADVMDELVSQVE